MRSPRGERGSILLDYFIALAFFMAVLGAFLELAGADIRSTGAAERRAVAVMAAESRLAEVRAGAAGAGAFAVLDRPAYAGEVRIEPRPDGLRNVVVEVRWTESDGAEARTSIASVIAAELPR